MYESPQPLLRSSPLKHLLRPCSHIPTLHLRLPPRQMFMPIILHHLSSTSFRPRPDLNDGDAGVGEVVEVVGVDGGGSGVAEVEGVGIGGGGEGGDEFSEQGLDA